MSDTAVAVPVAIPVEKPSRIPKMSRSQIRKLAKRIRPILRFAKVVTETHPTASGGVEVITRLNPKGKLQRDGRGSFYFIKPVNPFTVAFAWSPTPVGRPPRLQELCTITTYHGYAFYGFFKPSVAEVIAQIPKEHLDTVVAFSVKGPETAEDLNKHIEELNEGYHVAQTTLYIVRPRKIYHKK